MGLIDRLPGIGKKVKGMKYGVVGMLNKSVDESYKKAIANYKVLGMSLESGVPYPKIVAICEKFFKENKKESSFSDEMCWSLNSLFGRIELGEFEPEDGKWILAIVLPYLENRKRALKFAVAKKALR